MSLLCTSNKAVRSAQVVELSGSSLVCVASSSVKCSWSPVAGDTSTAVFEWVHVYHPTSQWGPQPSVTKAASLQGDAGSIIGTDGENLKVKVKVKKQLGIKANVFQTLMKPNFFDHMSRMHYVNSLWSYDKEQTGEDTVEWCNMIRYSIYTEQKRHHWSSIVWMVVNMYHQVQEQHSWQLQQHQTREMSLTCCTANEQNTDPSRPGIVSTLQLLKASLLTTTHNVSMTHAISRDVTQPVNSMKVIILTNAGRQVFEPIHQVCGT